jgi:hypothetical protein
MSTIKWYSRPAHPVVPRIRSGELTLQPHSRKSCAQNHLREKFREFRGFRAGPAPGRSGTSQRQAPLRWADRQADLFLNRSDHGASSPGLGCVPARPGNAWGAMQPATTNSAIRWLAESLKACSFLQPRKDMLERSVHIFRGKHIAFEQPRDFRMDQIYPKCKYHRTGRVTTVTDADKEAALGEGWSDSPGGSVVWQGADPCGCFDGWDLGCLSSETQGRIRACLANAHADVIESGPDLDSSVRRASMRKVFDGFAEEYLKAGLLTESMLGEAIPRMVYEAAVSGSWQTGSLSKNSGCTLQYGRYWVPPGIPQMLTDLFRAPVYRWRARLEAKPGSAAPSTAQPSGRELQPQALARPKGNSSEQGERRLGARRATPSSHESNLARAARRQAVVQPILERKRWTRGRLATKAGVGKATLYGYLDGTRARISTENRKAIADSLDLKPEALPE